ncbi:Wzz/FepE/Etk N-terminal domain-containing protein [Hyphococcus flavus]|uniref:Wzz/FepE/Etk N-terminal domain-containing protein n=1 Tax=Hyphococcus flavus TaxID=1866326 RepID=A0AAF0CEZ6_9PROT|nr:XrtA system polysaccharide chain length determinant [Hyphococcus flavus]WDI32006.1 Wzz/FepE/Etk N-terminal domain-containing protein [Hyphococcus flavus]
MFKFSDLPQPIIRGLNGLWRRRWLIVIVAWGCALLGWLALWLVPDKYESRAHVFVQTETILEPVLTGFTARPDYSRRVEVMRLQLLTRPNVEQIIDRAGLADTIEAGSAMERRVKMEGMVDWVAGQIKIESPREMYFIISYKNSDPKIAQAVVDAVLNMLIEQDLGASLTESEAARRRLNLQIEEYEEKLAANERAVATFRSEHAAELTSIQGTSRQRELKENELTRVSDELDRTKGRILTLQNLISATPRRASGGELERLRVELASLRSQYEESHPDIRGVLARIEELESDNSALASNPEYIRLQSELSVARDSITALEAREIRLKDELNALDFATGQAPAVEAELRQIVREYEQTQKTYEELLSRRDRLELTRNLGAAGRGVEYQVFEWPTVALAPSDPPRLLLIIGVILLAGGAGAGAALGLAILDKSYTQASELQHAFGLPVLGALSEVASETVIAERKRDLSRLVMASVALVAVAGLYTYLTVFRIPNGTPEAATQSADAVISMEARS